MTPLEAGIFWGIVALIAYFGFVVYVWNHPWECCFGHNWVKHQECFVTAGRSDDRREVLIAWNQCKRCAKSKLVHILK